MNDGVIGIVFSLVYVSLKEFGVVDSDAYSWSIKDFHKCWAGSLAKRRLPWACQCNKLHSTICIVLSERVGRKQPCGPTLAIQSPTPFSPRSQIHLVWPRAPGKQKQAFPINGTVGMVSTIQPGPRPQAPGLVSWAEPEQRPEANAYPGSPQARRVRPGSPDLEWGLQPRVTLEQISAFWRREGRSSVGL